MQKINNLKNYNQYCTERSSWFSTIKIFIVPKLRSKPQFYALEKLLNSFEIYNHESALKKSNVKKIALKFPHFLRLKMSQAKKLGFCESRLREFWRNCCAVVFGRKKERRKRNQNKNHEESCQLMIAITVQKYCVLIMEPRLKLAQ